MPGRGSIHTAKWDRCVKGVKASGSKYNPYAVCTASLGYEGSIKRPYRRKVHYGQHKDCMWCDMGRIMVGKKPTMRKKIKKVM